MFWKVTAFSATLLSVLSISQAQAQTMRQTMDGSGGSTRVHPRKEKEMNCGETSRPMRVELRHIDPNGIGYNQGYTTAAGFFTLNNDWDTWVFFFDPRLHIFNDGRPAVNAGLGWRYLTSSRAWGMNAYYDYRKTKRFHYNQVAAGFESLGRIWDFRLNGYLPVGKHQSRLYDLDFSHFEGNSAILRRKYEYVLSGANAEAAAHVDRWKHYPMYFAAGPYYLTGKGASTWGGQARASFTIYDYLKVEGNVSYDHLFKWIGQGQVGLTFSFGGKKHVRAKKEDCKDALALARRAYQPVDRFEIIPVDKAHKHSTAIDPVTRLPYFFVFVDNTSSSLGTYESPYATLAAAESNSSPHDVIYVFPGDGTTKGMDAGITLQDFQRLWGSGVRQRLPTTLGAVFVPVMSDSLFEGVVITPAVTNAADAVVTVGNGNEISGLFLQNQGISPCINATNVTDLRVLNSTLVAVNSSGDGGIAATNFLGTLFVHRSTIDQAAPAIQVTNALGTCDVHVSKSQLLTNDGQTILFELSNAAGANLLLENSIITTNSNAIEFDMFGMNSIAALLYNNQILSDGNAFFGNSIGVTNIDLTCLQNTFSTEAGAINITQTGTLTGAFIDNAMNCTNGETFNLASNGTTGTLLFHNNQMLSADSTSILFTQTSGTLTTNFVSNRIGAGNGGGAQSVGIQTILSGGDYNLYASNNDIETGGDGINIDQQIAAGNVVATITNNSITAERDQYAFDFINNSSSNADLNFSGNVVLADYNGIFVEQNGPGDLNLVCNDNEMLAISSYPVFLLITDGTSDVSLSGNNLEGYTAVNVQQSGGKLDLAIDRNNISGPGSASPAISYLSFGTVVATLDITNNLLTSGNETITINFVNPGTVTTNITNNTIVGPIQAVNVFVNSAGGTYTMNLSENTIPYGGGYFLNAQAGTSTWRVNNNSFATLVSAPVSAETNGGTLCLQLNGNTAYPTPDAYLLQNSSGTFTLNPPQGNIGQIVKTGAITTAPCP